MSARSKRNPRSEELSVEKAFDWLWDEVDDLNDERREKFNAQRAVLAAGYLLQFCSEGGNSEVDRYIAFGLAGALQKAAAKL